MLGKGNGKTVCWGFLHKTVPGEMYKDSCYRGYLYD